MFTTHVQPGYNLCIFFMFSKFHIPSCHFYIFFCMIWSIYIKFTSFPSFFGLGQKYYVWNLRIAYKICLFRCWKTCLFCFPVFFLDFRWWCEIAGHLAMFLVSDREGHVFYFLHVISCDKTNIAWFDQDACINQTRMCQKNKSWLANTMWTLNHKPWTIFL